MHIFTGKRLSFIYLMPLIFVLMSPSAWSAPPLPGISAPTEPTCNVNHHAGRQLAQRLASAVPGMATPISATTKKVAVIRVSFQDTAVTNTYNQTVSQFAKFTNYYLENSYNLLTLNVTVSNGGSGAHGSYLLSRNISAYAGGISSDYANLAKDSIAAAIAGGFDFSTFDYVMIYHAGYGAESTGSYSDIWSVYVSANFSNYGTSLNGPTAGSKVFDGVTFVPDVEAVVGGYEVDPLGVTCHEFGHQLGLPDIYNTSTGNSVVGYWSLMDYGPYSGTPIGSNPAHLDAWSKQFLGFSVPQTVDASVATTQALSQSEVTRTACLRLPITSSSSGSDKEYYLLEYRRKTGATYDASLPGQGLLIWHIDDSIASDATRLSNNSINTSSTYPGVGLVLADSSGISSSNKGDSTDAWPGTRTTFTSPYASAYNGKDSGITISNISGVGNTSISFSLANPLNNPAILASRDSGEVIVAGTQHGWINPNKNETAVIAVRPVESGNVNLEIYSMDGGLVWNNCYTGRAGVQTSTRWDGKNSSGTDLASGIYTLYVSGGGVDIKKRIAVIK